jgi:hypothetical protein
MGRGNYDKEIKSVGNWQDWASLEWVGLISGTGDWVLVGSGSYGLSITFSNLRYTDLFM